MGSYSLTLAYPACVCLQLIQIGHNINPVDTLCCQKLSNLGRCIIYWRVHFVRFRGTKVERYVPDEYYKFPTSLQIIGLN